jgi:hypothetical protein
VLSFCSDFVAFILHFLFSYCAAWRIHVSESAAEILTALGGYLLTERGLVEMKVRFTIVLGFDFCLQFNKIIVSHISDGSLAT